MKRYRNVRHVPELAGLSPQEQTYVLHQFRPRSFFWLCWPLRLTMIIGGIINITFILIVTNLPTLPDQAWMQILLMSVPMFTYGMISNQVYIQHVRPYLAEARARLSDGYNHDQA